jgi:hypothetical protein
VREGRHGLIKTIVGCTFINWRGSMVENRRLQGRENYDECLM